MLIVAGAAAAAEPFAAPFARMSARFSAAHSKAPGCTLCALCYRRSVLTTGWLSGVGIVSKVVQASIKGLSLVKSIGKYDLSVSCKPDTVTTTSS